MTPGPVNPAQHIFRSPQLRGVVQQAVQFLDSTPPHPLPPARFAGAGVYLLYYSGTFDLYSHSARHNQETPIQPIYVGKAVLPGSRTARSGSTGEENSLHQRLREHFRSIQSVTNLEERAFQCRFIILDDPEADLIPAVETAFIKHYTPLWNVGVDGFGNHDPGKGRYNQARSEWDVLHPGRAWAERLTGPPPRLEAIIAKIRHHQRR